MHDSPQQPTESQPPAATELPVQKATRMRARRRIIFGFVLVLLCAAAAFGATWAAIYLSSDDNILSSITAETDGNTITTGDEENVASIAEKVSPSVVSIVTTVQSRDVFGTSYGEGAGTGIVVSKDGYIMTNNHVIDGASDVEIVMSDGTTYDDVTVIGNDPLNDVAFLKIEGVDNLTSATLGDSSSVRIGQRVVTIGNALGQYQNTVTSGIISGTGRPVTASSGDGTSTETLTDLIQTDAAINSGNSGGPMVNAAGQVIGINTAVASDANGIGFAIPINATKGVLASVLENGAVEKAYIGVQFTDITPDVASEYNLPVSRGAYVAVERGSAVATNGPADDAGIEDGDIIVSVDGKQVGEQGSLSSLIGEHRPGDTVELGVVRGDKELTISVTLGQYR